MVLELMATPSFAWTPKGSTGPLDKIAVYNIYVPFVEE